ncbi:DUF3014 domain-containing protein [Thalassotalea litorea]|uniref:DUF3014 domain-containing protein n=1 Tax=Thalassotalea litorea TaxID=2020715 RepID=A0A5R9IH39_9GAMM|nr:DUF3014 domain-containing protein [Thalassotalea litorea]TLU64854.1 DUF3014 domain-containing protein [Thalassotalea litorea]
MNTEQKQSSENQQSAPLGIIVFIIALVILGGAYYMVFIDNPTSRPQPEIVDLKDEKLQIEPQISEPEDIDTAPETQPQAPEMVAEPEPAEPASEVILPELDNSDELTVSLIREATMAPELLDVLIPSDIIRRTVVFADNFARGDLTIREAPVYPPQGKFQASQINDQEFVISPENFSRYVDYLDLLASFEPAQLTAVYQQLSPLFEEAFQELGFPERTFNDVATDVIDRILAVEYPEVSPVLTQPDMVYKFQSEDLESLPDADKLLLRIGKENLLQLQSVAHQIQKQLD